MKYHILLHLSDSIPSENFFYSKEDFIYKNLSKITKDLQYFEYLSKNRHEEQVIFDNIVYELENVFNTEDLNDFILYFEFVQDYYNQYDLNITPHFIDTPSKHDINTISEAIENGKSFRRSRHLQNNLPLKSSFINSSKLLFFIMNLNNYLKDISLKNHQQNFDSFINSINELFFNLTSNGIGDKSLRIKTYKKFFEEKSLIFYPEKILSSYDTERNLFNSLLFTSGNKNVELNSLFIINKLFFNLDCLDSHKLSMLINITYIEMKEMFGNQIHLSGNLICVKDNKQVDNIMILNQRCFSFFQEDFFTPLYLDSNSESNFEIREENLLFYLCNIFKNANYKKEQNEKIITIFHMNMEKHLLNKIQGNNSEGVKDKKRL